MSIEKHRSKQLNKHISRTILFALLFINSLVSAQEGIRYKHGEEAKAPQLTKAPVLLKFVEAVYPPDALKERIQGTVEMLVDIDVSGNVTNVAVTKSAGHGFDEAAAEAVRKFVFSPAEVDNAPSPIQIGYNYNFIISVVPAKIETAPAEENAVSVTGTVREKGVKIPVVGAAVSVNGTDMEVITDKKGNFQIKGLPPGKYQITILAPEYERTEIEAEVKKDAVTDLEIFLILSQAIIYETVVKGKREEQVVTKYVLKKQEIQTIPGTFGDPVKVIQNLPGVARSPYMSGFLLVRGATPQESGYYLDGVAIPMLYHFLGGPSVLHPEFLERIDFYPGNFGVKYGRATGGIVDVATLSTVAETWYGVADINLLNASLYLEVPVTEKFTLKFGGRRSYIDLIIPVVLDAAGEKGTTIAPIYYDYQVRGDYKPSDSNRFSLFLFGSDDRLTIITDDKATEGQFNISSVMSFHRLLAQWYHRFSPDVTSMFCPYLGYDVTSFNTGISYMDITSFSPGLREDINWKISSKLSLHVGTDIEGAQATFKALAPSLAKYAVPGQYLDSETQYDTGAGPGDLEKISRDVTYLAGAVFLEPILNLGHGVELIPALRFDYFSYYDQDRYSWDPRLTARWDTGWFGLTLKGGAGIYHRLPDFFYLDREYGNPYLSLEWADQYSLGFEKKFTDYLSLEMQGFLVFRHRRAVFSKNVEESGNGIKQEIFSSEGKGRSYGMELLARHEVSRNFYGWISYTLSKSEESLGKDEPYISSMFDQTHILTALGSYRLGSGWEIGLRFRLVSGNKYTPVYGSTFLGDKGNYFSYNGVENSKRQTPFNQLDFRIEKTWSFETWYISAYLDIQNIYNATNPEFTAWDYRFKKKWLVPGLPVLPSFGIKARF
jgi:TonB family protein